MDRITGLLKSIEDCEPTLNAPPVKDRNERDAFLRKAVHGAASSLRDCIAEAQPSLARLVESLAGRIRAAA